MLGKVPGQGWSQAGGEEWDVHPPGSSQNTTLCSRQGLVRRANVNYAAEPQHSPTLPTLLPKAKNDPQAWLR